MTIHRTITDDTNLGCREPGDMLCVEGAHSPECYVVQEGHAVVTIARKGAATVTSTSHMITYAISRERLRSLVDGDPAVREWMPEGTRRGYQNVADHGVRR